jgi:TPR repeat protein
MLAGAGCETWGRGGIVPLGEGSEARARAAGDAGERWVAKDPHERAYSYHREAARKGEVEAMCGSGADFAAGVGVQKDRAGTMEWFRKRARRFHVMCRGLVGYTMQSGVGRAVAPTWKSGGGRRWKRGIHTRG